MDAVIEESPCGRLPSVLTEASKSARRNYRYARAVAVSATLLVALCLTTGLGGVVVERTVSNVALTAAALGAAVACGWKARQVSGRMRWSWGLIAGAVLSWGLGQFVWTWYESILGDEVPFPSLADVGYLGMPILTAAGLLFIPMASQSIAHRARSVLDGLMIAASLLLISWVVVLGPLIMAGADSRLAMIISLAYPVSDVVTVTMVLYIFARGRQMHSTPMPLVLIGSGLVTFAISDSGFAYLTMTGMYNSGAVIDLGWFIGFLLIGIAALKPTCSADASGQTALATRPLGVLLPYVAVIAAVITSSLELLRSVSLGAFVPWNRNVLILLIVGRQMLTLLENRALTRDLEGPGRGAHRRVAGQRATLPGAGPAQLGRGHRGG